MVSAAQGGETKLTPLFLKTYAQKFDFKTIFFLDLKNRSISAIGAITDCANLQTLNLAHNNIQSIVGLDSCIELKLLDLSYNRIQQVGSLATCKKLQKLDLQGNRISDIKSFPDSLTQLRTLYLQEFVMSGANPICDGPAYREKVFDKYPNLLALDGVRKSTPMNCNMIEAIPAEEEVQVDYDTSAAEWYDNTGEIQNPNNALATRFESSITLKREEKELQVFLNEMQDLLKKKTNILTY